MTTDNGRDLLAGHFGTYILPGRVTDPLRGVDEAKEAERLGLGSVWMSERFSLKEPAVMSGALSQATSRIQIRSTFYATMRHPLVLASIANMMQAMSRDRFGVVFARALPAFLQVMGAEPVTFTRLRDAIQILRKLCAGETVSYSGILGDFPTLKLADYYAGMVPPIIMTAMGPRALAFAGENCDGVFLHPFVSPAGVAAGARIVREAAKKAGRDPSAPRYGEPGLDQKIGYLTEWYELSAKGRSIPIIDTALRHVSEHRPQHAPVNVLWGDATAANMLFDPEGNVCALIDWELATLGPAESDLGWWLFFDDLFSDGFCIPRLEGLPSRDESIAIWEEAVGRKARDLEYYEILAGLCMSLVTVGSFHRLVLAGKVRPDNETPNVNPITRALAPRVGLTPPEFGPDFVEFIQAVIGNFTN